MIFNCWSHLLSSIYSFDHVGCVAVRYIYIQTFIVHIHMKKRLTVCDIVNTIQCNKIKNKMQVYKSEFICP